MKRTMLVCVGVVLSGVVFGGSEYASVSKEIAALPGLVRYWNFDANDGYVIENLAPSDETKRAVGGGPLGSLVFLHNTGWDLVSPRTRQPWKGEQDGEWISGRLPGKHAFSVGTYDYPAFRAGLDGSEFTNGFTFACWMRLPDATNRFLSAYAFMIGDLWNTGFGLRMGSFDHKTGDVVAAFAHGKNPQTGKQDFTEVRVKGVSAEVWHFVAVRWDGKRDLSLAVDDLPPSIVAMEKPFEPITIRTTGAWTECYRFFEGNVPCRFTLGGGTARLQNKQRIDLDELALFNRPLTDAELALFRRVPAGTPSEQIAASKQLSVDRAARQSVFLGFPKDTIGYFRTGETFPAQAKGAAAAGKTLRLRLETLMGKPVLKKEVVVSAAGEATIHVKLDECGVYLAWLELVNADGSVWKRPVEPFSIGIVPPKPAHLDSPIGYWAMMEHFSFDSNLRRTMFDWYRAGWGALPSNRLEWCGHCNQVARKRTFIEKQGIAPEDLRMYACLPHACSPTAKISERDLAEHKIVWAWSAESAKELGIREFEVTSEVDGRTTPDAYMTNLKLIHEAITKEVPDAIFYPPGATPCALPFIAQLLERGAWKYSVGVSHHNYIANPVHWYRWDGLIERFHALLAKYKTAEGKPLEMYNTETVLNSLPRVRNRPMPRGHARACGYPVQNVDGLEGYMTSTPEQPEEESAAYQSQAVICNLLGGFRMTVMCGGGIQSHYPSYWGVAMTALSGQVLNGYEDCREVTLPSLKSVAALIRRHTPSPQNRRLPGPLTTVLALFGNEEATYSFAVPPNATYRTMDMFGNFGTVRATAAGVLTLNSSIRPTYVFDIPETIKALSPMSLELPTTMPESGRMEGKVLLDNPFDVPLVGTLAGVAVRGMTIDLAETKVSLAPKAKAEVKFTVDGRGLKRRSYPVRLTLKGPSGDYAAERAFEARGVIRTIPLVMKPMPLDGDVTKWADIEPETCESAEDVVHGVPDLAQAWLPQWRNADDQSLRLRLAYCRDVSINFLLEVKDNVVYPLPEGKKGPFLYDCLELFVDSRTGASLGAPVGEGADQLMVVPTRSEQTVPARLDYAKPGCNHVNGEMVTRRTKDGYLIEGRIVPNEKSGLRLRPGSRLLMDFLVDDTDTDAEIRKSAMAFHGSFNNNSNISGWGRYELGLQK